MSVQVRPWAVVIVGLSAVSWSADGQPPAKPVLPPLGVVFGTAAAPLYLVSGDWGVARDAVLGGPVLSSQGKGPVVFESLALPAAGREWRLRARGRAFAPAPPQVQDQGPTQAPAPRGGRAPTPARRAPARTRCRV
ncbi:MAG: hypothetical protein NZ700_10060, partial [Gemmataceae bacterium]|nr:hypothetical protein [Gemmataceae bacterium]MDW8264942.1 hypothetical protein [Gemmataceae bacterium]